MSNPAEGQFPQRYQYFLDCGHAFVDTEVLEEGTIHRCGDCKRHGKIVRTEPFRIKHPDAAKPNKTRGENAATT